MKYKELLNTPFNKILSWTAYPVVMVLGFALHYLLISADYGIQLSTYVPVILCALIITSLEYRLPHRGEWKATSNDVKNDLLFMGFVQVLLPQLLSFLIAIGFLNLLESRNLVIKNVWPHSLTTYLQAILMVLIADFFRYWLHILHHKWEFLWRFHSVHHSPQKLYWINVGRFHPIEKTLQFFLDALPFIILGVNEYVIALYFVFYSINGFFQHSNVDVRLGPLNYIVSGPELHRWHHSMSVGESNHNFGNNLIIWDLIFGSWYLPEEKEVDQLGVQNREYPMEFVDQLKAPFNKVTDQE
jgi:ornithine lipid hydroxylase